MPISTAGNHLGQLLLYSTVNLVFAVVSNQQQNALQCSKAKMLQPDWNSTKEMKTSHAGSTGKSNYT